MKTKVRILIFEDDRLSQLSTQMELQAQKEIEIQRLDCYDQYNDAAYATTNKKYKMAIIDLMIGQSLEGLRFAKLCLKRNIFPVILTNIGDEKILQELHDNGIKHIFLKSDRDAIQKAVKAYIEHSQKNKKETFFIENFLTENPILKKNITKILEKKDLLGELIVIHGAPNTGKYYLASQIIDYFYSMKSEVCIYPIDASNSYIPQGIRTSVKDNKNVVLLVNNFNSRNPGIDIFIENCFEKENVAIVILLDAPVLSMMNDDNNKKIIEKMIDAYKIGVPSLVDRKEDIILLLNHFSQKETKLSEDAKKALLNFSWPKNLQDLNDIATHLKENFLGHSLINKKDLPLEIFSKKISDSTSLLNDLIIDSVNQNGLLPVIKNLKKEIILHYFNKNGQKYRETAKELSISTTVLYNSLK